MIDDSSSSNDPFLKFLQRAGKPVQRAPKKTQAPKSLTQSYQSNKSSSKAENMANSVQGSQQYNNLPQQNYLQPQPKKQYLWAQEQNMQEQKPIITQELQSFPQNQNDVQIPQSIAEVGEPVEAVNKLPPVDDTDLQNLADEPIKNIHSQKPKQDNEQDFEADNQVDYDKFFATYDNVDKELPQTLKKKQNSIKETQDFLSYQKFYENDGKDYENMTQMKTGYNPKTYLEGDSCIVDLNESDLKNQNVSQSDSYKAFYGLDDSVMPQSDRQRHEVWKKFDKVFNKMDGTSEVNNRWGKNSASESYLANKSLSYRDFYNQGLPQADENGIRENDKGEDDDDDDDCGAGNGWPFKRKSSEDDKEQNGEQEVADDIKKAGNDKRNPFYKYRFGDVPEAFMGINVHTLRYSLAFVPSSIILQNKAAFIALVDGMANGQVPSCPYSQRARFTYSTSCQNATGGYDNTCIVIQINQNYYEGSDDDSDDDSSDDDADFNNISQKFKSVTSQPTPLNISVQTDHLPPDDAQKNVVQLNLKDNKCHAKVTKKKEAQPPEASSEQKATEANSIKK